MDLIRVNVKKKFVLLILYCSSYLIIWVNVFEKTFIFFHKFIAKKNLDCKGI